METIEIPKNEYLSMKQQISELQKKIKYFQDKTFMEKLQDFMNLFADKNKNIDFIKESEKLPFKFGVAKDFITISDDFNSTPEEFNDYL